MNRVIFCVCLLLASLADAAKVYELHMIIYKNDSVKLVSFNVTDGRAGPFPTAGEDNYLFRMLSDNGTEIHNQSFQMDFFAYRFRGANSTLPDVVPLEQREEYWKLPYYEDVATIELFHEERKIFEYRVKPEKEEWQIHYCAFAPAVISLVLVCIASVISGDRPRIREGRGGA